MVATAIYYSMKKKASREPRPRGSLEERFWRYVFKEPNSGCWLWTGVVRGSTVRMSYGQITIRRGVVHKAHRVSWELHIGPIPPRALVCHKCDTPSCVNPGHLFLGTPAENSQDMVRKGRSTKGRCAPLILRGEERGKSTKLTTRKVIAILSSRLGTCALARKYGVDPATISKIKHGKCWSHVPRPTKKECPP